jgi:hypothetical protein
MDETAVAELKSMIGEMRSLGNFEVLEKNTRG